MLFNFVFNSIAYPLKSIVSDELQGRKKLFATNEEIQVLTKTLNGRTSSFSSSSFQFISFKVCILIFPLYSTPIILPLYATLLLIFPLSFILIPLIFFLYTTFYSSYFHYTLFYSSYFHCTLILLLIFFIIVYYSILFYILL